MAENWCWHFHETRRRRINLLKRKKEMVLGWFFFWHLIETVQWSTFFSLIFLLLDYLRHCGLSTTSRDNQVLPEVFEMFNTIGSWVSLSAASYSSHTVFYECVYTHTHNHTHSYTHKVIILGSAYRDISFQTPQESLLILCDVWVCICAWMCVNAVKCYL